MLAGQLRELMWVVVLWEIGSVLLLDAGGVGGEKGEDGVGWDCGSELEELVAAFCVVLFTPTSWLSCLEFIEF